MALADCQRAEQGIVFISEIKEWFLLPVAPVYLHWSFSIHSYKIKAGNGKWLYSAQPEGVGGRGGDGAAPGSCAGNSPVRGGVGGL